MKNAITSKKPLGKRQPPPQSIANPDASSRWKHRIGLGLCLFLAAGGTWAVLEFVVWNKLPPELIGKWVVMDGPDEGGTVDFHRNGTMVAKVNNRGMEGIIEAEVRVEDNKIHVTTRNRETGERGTRIQTIKISNGNRLILQDERGVSIKLERAE